MTKSEKAAELARQRYAKTKSYRALVAMQDATLKALAAYARRRAPGSTSAKPSDAQQALL